MPPARTPVPPPEAAYTRFASQYDDWFAPAGGTDVTVAFLASLTKEAPPGPLLELGIGTGRIALPLAEEGLAVHGIDSSPQMVARLRAKPGGRDIPVTMGNFADPPAEEERGTYALVYVANGTFAEITTQADQLACFAGAARRLRPGGLFVLDAHLPEALATVSSGTRPVNNSSQDFVLCTRSIHPAKQHYVSDYVVLDGDQLRHVRVTFRYASPGELDLMAGAAGLRLRHRAGGWSGVPFKDSSSYHVSVYELPA
ncbi:class I SAM-dependent methyltransferase [Streptomyces sp. NBC_00059]|uniref:class I SAM-dependent DNA methyltransferase n=1 Tax=Streptomyces sp. NBC_00059 TaxID=2975635 RepID=UPI00224CEAA6|nr:class I SAM-dependent methyltransferase [Streptomyces sp. NBC_00059]MCX5415968.1 class I SAM-dependent methyltransferase [Streptomyces sp. NBC_00059]